MSAALRFRPARPEDAAAVVPLMYESSRALLDYNFGFPDADPQGFLARDFARGDGIFGWRHQFVAVDEHDAVVGTVTAYPSRLLGRLSRQTVRSVLAHFGLRRGVVVAWRSLHMKPLFIAPRADSVFIANACVAATRRGGGIFPQLLAHALAAAREPASTCAELDVSFTNERAQRLYERTGWKVMGERPYRGPRALVGFRRMQRALDGS
jgi:ribosomal protein S18 acetylase RimI-like enzyme